MPIQAAQTMLEAQIKASLKLGMAAQSDVVATLIAGALASTVPSGSLPTTPTPTPLAPAGFDASRTGMQIAFKQGLAATPESVAISLAGSVAAMAPQAPPTALAQLQTQLTSAFKKGKSAESDSVATDIASAIIQYYVSGGII